MRIAKRNQSRSAIMMFVAAFIAFCFLSLAATFSAASPNTFYVATNGSDSNPGTIGSPFLTVQRGINALACGDTVNIRAGTYDGGVGFRQRCNSWSNALTIQNYPGEVVTLIYTGHDLVFGSASTVYPARENAYVILQGVIIDAAYGNSTSGCVGGLSVDHVRLKDLECRNAQRVGIIPHGQFWEFLNVNSHDNGLDTDPSHARGHGIYLTDGNCLIDGGSYHDNGGYGIQIYDNGSITNGNNIVRNARIYNNNLAATGNPLDGNGGGGIVMANGTNNVAFNNIIYGNGAINLQINGTCLGCAAYNNTEYGGQTGIAIVDRFAVGTIVKNNIFFGNQASSIANSGTGTVLSNNLTSDPLFTNPGIGDFTLQASSPAINTGANLSSIFATDFKGASRPVGGAFDIGAYEFGGQPAPDSIPPTVSMKATSGSN